MLKWLLVTVALVAGLGFVAKAVLSPSVTKRFVLDVAVEIDGRVLEGSTVWEMTATKLFNPLGNSLPVRNNVRGEAIPLRVSDDETLFVLRRAQRWMSTRTYGALLFHGCGIRQFEALARFEGTCDVTGAIPDVVSVSNEPDGSAPTIGFQDTGPVELGRARIVKITVTTTEAPITVGLVREFPWILTMAQPDSPTGVPGEGTFWMKELYVQDFTTEAQ